MLTLLVAIATMAIGAAAGTVSNWITPPKWIAARRWRAILVAFIVVCALGIVGACIGWITTPKVARANMVNVADQGTVSRPFKVKGRAYEVPAGHALWVATPSDDMKIWYWADGNCKIDPGGGVQRPFTCADLYLGEDQNSTESYSIYLFDADADAVRELEKHAARDPSQAGVGIEQPKGVTEIDVVHDIALEH